MPEDIDSEGESGDFTLTTASPPQAQKPKVKKAAAKKKSTKTETTVLKSKKTVKRRSELDEFLD